MPNPSTEAPQPEPLAATAPLPRAATILQVLPALGAEGGVERGTVEVAGAIVAAGGRALVASAGGPQTAALAGVGGAHVTLPLATKNPLALIANAARLARLIRAEGVDLVHARSRAPAWSAWVAARRTGVPFVTTFHGTYGAGTAAKRAYNRVMTRGVRVIAISQHIARHLTRVYGIDVARIRVIPRGVDTAAFDPATVSPERVTRLRRAWGLDTDRPVVLLPGRLTRWKGQTVFLDALAHLPRRDLSAVLLGSDQGRTGYRRELDALIRAHGLGDVVHIIERCDDMPAAFCAADLVVSASTDPEAFGRIAVEAQAMGRPVIASDHGGARETVLAGVTGWLTRPGDPDALARALADALATPPERLAAMAAAGIDHVRRSFTTSRMCARTLAVYAEVLGAGPAGTPTP